jgi:hypothetical protein
MWYVHLFALGIKICARVSRKCAGWACTKDSGVAPTEGLTHVINAQGTMRPSNTSFNVCAQWVGMLQSFGEHSTPFVGFDVLFEARLGSHKRDWKSTWQAGNRKDQMVKVYIHFKS